MEKIAKKIRQLYPLPKASLEQLLALLETSELPKGSFLFKAGLVSHRIYFLEVGIARAFCYKEDKEVTFWFGAEGDIILPYYSYIANKPGYETVELLEDSLLYSIDLQSIQELFRTDIALANWGRKLAEYELVKTEERFIGMQFQTALERYKALLAQHPQLLQRVQLGYIASYLGVTQVTLSRIRAELRD